MNPSCRKKLRKLPKAPQNRSKANGSDYCCGNFDSAVIDYLEEAYAAHLLSIDNPKFEDIEIKRGNWSALEKLDKIIECSLVYNEFKYITLSLRLETEELCMKFVIEDTEYLADIAKDYWEDVEES